MAENQIKDKLFFQIFILQGIKCYVYIRVHSDTENVLAFRSSLFSEALVSIY